MPSRVVTNHPQTVVWTNFVHFEITKTRCGPMEGSLNQVRGASKDRIGLQHQRKTLHGCSKVLQKLLIFPIILFHRVNQHKLIWGSRTEKNVWFPVKEEPYQPSVCNATLRLYTCSTCFAAPSLSQSTCLFLNCTFSFSIAHSLSQSTCLGAGVRRQP